MPIADLRFKKQDGTYMPLYATSGESILGLLGLGATSIKYLDQIFKGDINMFSKHKPVKNNSVTPGEDYWKANNGQCGIVIPQLSNDLSDFTTKVWTYDRPRGNNIVAGEHLRVNDFFYYGKYNKNAQPVIASGYKNTIEWNVFTSQSLSLSTYVGASYPGSPSLGLSDIPLIANMYLSVSVGDTPQMGNSKSADTTLSQGGTTVAFTAREMSRFSSGQTKLWFFISLFKLEWDNAQMASTYYPIYNGHGFMNPVPLKIIKSVGYNARLTKIKDANREWQTLTGFNQVIKIAEFPHPLVELQITNTSANQVITQVKDLFINVQGYRPLETRAVPIYADNMGTNSVATISAMAGETVNYYFFVDFNWALQAVPTPLLVSLELGVSASGFNKMIIAAAPQFSIISEFK